MAILLDQQLINFGITKVMISWWGVDENVFQSLLMMGNPSDLYNPLNLASSIWNATSPSSDSEDPGSLSCVAYSWRSPSLWGLDFLYLLLVHGLRRLSMC